MSEERIVYEAGVTRASVPPTRTCVIILDVAPAQMLHRLQQLRNEGLETVLVRLHDWRVEDPKAA